VPRWFQGSQKGKPRATAPRQTAPKLPATPPSPPAAPAGSPATSAAPARRPRVTWRKRLRFWGFVVLGVAVTAGAGYLVAALWLFPSPLLPSERRVIRVIGLTEEEARRNLVRGELAVDAVREPHPNAAAGVVVWQDPAPEVAIPRGSRVTITVSAGPPRVAVPDVTGLDYELAIRILSAAGLRLEMTDSVDVRDGVQGVAVRTQPRAGDSVRIGSGVILSLAR